jgi:hypothetical protein
VSDALPFKPPGDYERRQLADEAKDLLDNKAFCAAILALRKTYHAELMASKDEYMDRILKARMQALESIPQELQILINDQKMAQARKQ